MLPEELAGSMIQEGFVRYMTRKEEREHPGMGGRVVKDVEGGEVITIRRGTVSGSSWKSYRTRTGTY